jgi:hypothetical protein
MFAHFTDEFWVLDRERHRQPRFVKLFAGDLTAMLQTMRFSTLDKVGLYPQLLHPL